ncbi:MAG: hypothetical protein JWQ18_2581 [Conexibacter sp.]|nr:hypothetical protein [Conexibacter sp.]
MDRLRALLVVGDALAQSIEPADDLLRASHLCDAGDELLADALVRSQANVLIHQRAIEPATFRRWRVGLRSALLISVRLGEESLPVASSAHPEEWARAEGDCEGVRLLAVPTSEDMLSRALGAAERVRQNEDSPRADSPRAEASWSRSRRPPTVLMVGLGVVNLVTAHWLARAGFEVSAVDAGPDPRLGESWKRYGCSRGGANARMFTLTEADDYHDRTLGRPPVHAQFRRPVSLRGWQLCAPGAAEEEWIGDFERVPAWLARAYNADTLALNRASGALWDTWIQADPHLFADVELTRDIVRIYSDAGQFAESLRRQDSVGATKQVYTPAQLRAAQPALADAPAEAIAGCIVVEGFTLCVHDLMAALLDDLEAAGADLRFETRVSELLRDGEGRVMGALTGDHVVRSDHFVLSLGAEFSSLSPPPALRNRVHGVLGCWATVPNIEPRLTASVKLARRGHNAEDANVTVARDPLGDPILVFGSGYGYVGSRGKIDESELEALYRALVDTVRVYFPRALDAAGKDRVRESFRHCVRPWTASNLGVFETEPTPRGLAVWTGGHNTGGFAQAPVIAEAVHTALSGGRHAMHVAYSPRRWAAGAT